MSEEKIYDITIIGGGPVGLWAAFYAGLRGMTVNIIESLSELGGQPAILYPEKKIYDIPAFPQTTGAELTENLLTQLKRFEDRVSIHLKEEVQTFEKTDGIFTIATSKGQHLSKAIVIACGNGAFAPRPLGVDNEEDYADNNLFYNVHSLDQFAGKKVVIAGGWDSAVDWANHLDGVAESVMTPYVPLEIKGESGLAKSLTVQKVKSDEVVELPLDALIVSFGFSTNNKNLRNWNIDFKRSSVTVNAQFETSQEGVYAIGDAAEYEGKIDLIAVGMGEAPIAINQAIQYIDPDGKNRPVHSTSLIEE